MSFAIAADHPSLPGHFPGQPIVPGVVLLAEIFARIEDAFPGTCVAVLLHAKFLAPVRPGEAIALSFEPPVAGRVGFAGLVAGTRVLHGTVQLA